MTPRSKTYTYGSYAKPKGFVKFARNTMSAFMSLLVAAQPIMAQTANIVADGAGTTVYEAGNGVTTVDIATPNAAGLSQNTFTDFNVGTGGAILNNSNASLDQSQLGGLLQGNGNLATSGPATVILNEVTGGNRSVLEGALEVHGRSADVIIANANGITCNGCGFINTPRVTLSTGTAQIGANGALAGFAVNGGDVLIGANGADARSAAIFDIVSRRISVQGPIAAGGDLGLYAGQNDFDYGNRTATSRGTDDNAPAIAIDSSLLGGMYAGRITVLSTEAGSGVNMQGQMASNAGEMTLTADGRLVMGQVQARGPVRATSQSSTVRAERTIFSDDAVTLQGLTAVEIAANALVASQSDVTLNGANITLETGAIAAAGVTSAGAQTQSGTLSLAGTAIDAGEGTLVAGAEITLDAASVDLSRTGASTADNLRSLGNVTISADVLTATNGQIRAGDTLTISSDDALSVNGGDFASVGALTVMGNSITTSATLSTQDTATVRATTGSVTNTGRVAGDDQTVVTAETAVTNRGDLVSQTSVTVTAGTTLNNTDSGQIIGGQTTTQSQSLDNAGLIAAQSGNLAITTDQTIDNTGTLVGVAALDIDANGALRNEGDIVAQGTITVASQNGAAAGAITNQTEGLINGGAGVQFEAASVDNAGAIGSSAGALAVDLAGDLDNTGLLYSGTSSTYRLDGDFTNTNADIIAETNLTITGLTGPRAGNVLNSSGTIEAVAGNITITADDIINSRPAPTITTSSTEVVTGSDSPSRPGEGHTNTATLTTTTTTIEAAHNNGVAAQILAGGNLSLDATSVTNDYSQIAANGDVTIVAGAVANTGRDLIETTDVEAVRHHWRRQCSWGSGIFCGPIDDDRWTTTTTDQATATIGAEFGTIEAGGTLSAVVSGYLDNNAVRDGADQVGLSSGDRALAAVDAVAISGNSLGDLTLSIDTVLDRGALFDPATDPNAPYLVETRSDFIDASQFLGSDYFLGQIGGYDPDQTMRRFGDAYIETRLIREQIFGQTGGRYLAAGLDDVAQMRALYDNAVDAQRDLNLAIGVALTPDQIAVLTSDIVWLETQVVQGQEVLVPRLYLSQATLANIDLNSAQIRSGQTNIFAGAIANSGALSGVNGLSLSSGSIFANAGGSLFSNADITINAGTVFANQSGRIIGGGDVSITAETVVSNTEKSRDEMPSGFTDRAQQSARIEAGGNLQINAAGSIGSVGGEFIAGDAIKITAGDSIEITALELETNRDDDIDGGYDREYTRTNTLATIAAGGDLNITTGSDLTLRGVDASAGGDAALTAEGSVNIASVQDIAQSDFKRDTGGRGIFSSERNIRQQDASVDTVRTVIAANRRLTITANTGDLTVAAATLQSGDATRLSAAGQVALLSETDSTFTQDFERKESLFWWSEGDEGQSIETIEMVEVHADGGFTIDAGTGIVIEYEAHDNLDEALTTISAQPGLEWMGDMRTNPSVDWNGVEATVQEWDYQEQGLTEAGALLVTAVVTYATGGVTAGWAESIAGSWGLGAAGQAAVQAGLGNLLTQSSVALVNNQGDLGATLEQLGSDEGLRSLVTAMVSAGFTAQLNNAAGLGDFDPTTATAMENTIYRAQTGLIGASVNATVSTAINGGDIGDNLTAGWTNAMVMAGLAGVQHSIGDFGDANGLPEGSLPKILAHAVAGGLASEAAGGSFADGAMAAALAEAAGPLVGESGLPRDRQIELQRLIGTTAILIANGGDAADASIAAGIAASAHENNYLNHEEAVARLDAKDSLEECQSGSQSCSAERISELEDQVIYYEQLDQLRDAMLMQVCQNPMSGACIQAVSAARVATASYETDPDRYTRLGDDWMAAARAGSGSGPAWDPEAFGFGLAGGALLGMNTAMGAVVVKEAAAMCGSQPLCTAAVVSQMVGAEVVAEFAGGAVVVSALDGSVLRRIDLNPAVLPTPATRGTLTGRTASTTSTDPEAIRGIARENESAQNLADNGFDVVQNPGVLPNGKTPDLRLNGEIYDVVAPSTNRARNIGSRIEGKVVSGQTQNVVVNLADTTVSPSQLTQQLTDYPIAGLKSVVIIDRSGAVLPVVRFD